MCSPQTNHDDTLRYGEKLYSHTHFNEWFATFEKDQKRSATLIWERVFEKCGKDQDLPPITHVVDYGCGEGTFLKCLHECYTKAISDKPDTTSRLTFLGIDCCANAINKAKQHTSINSIVRSCDPCPKNALGALFEGDPSIWRKTALIVMGHSWFHFDQNCLVKTILALRPALILVDVYQSWNDVVNRLRNGSSEEMEHGRRFEGGETYWLRTQKCSDDKVNRGIYHIPVTGFPKWEFVTCQHTKTTEELFGGLSHSCFECLNDEEKESPSKVLSEARSRGDFVETIADSGRFCAYVHDRQYLHNTGWGPMECHVLVSLDPIARLLNAGWFKVISRLISEAVPKPDSPSATSIDRMIKLFDDPSIKHSFESTHCAAKLPGSREALVVLPFQPNATFARILPIFDGQDATISKFPLLVEHPTRWQTQFPSANGVFQTCLGHSSNAQAFPTAWAHDYDLTPADKALGKLELEVLGLDEEGVWPGESQAASYFMVPFYRGSLPLFCLALKFPQNFAPETTGFEVYQSTIKSLHDAIQTSLTDDRVRHRVIRPWIEECLKCVWPSYCADKSGEWKLAQLEESLFGTQCDHASAEAKVYQVGKDKHCGGVLSREWKSWILGLPSFPINRMAKIIDENRQLWEIWKQEKGVALLDAPLRIALWFQDGQFFEDKAHDDFICKVHLPRLQKMFSKILGYSKGPSFWKTCQDLKSAIDWLKTEKTRQVANYFGDENVKHFLFHFLVRHLEGLCSSEDGKAETSFKALKAVFCKTNANTGKGVRFGMVRLHHLVDAARWRDERECAGTLEPSSSAAMKEADERSIFVKFWSADDPSFQIAEFVHRLAAMDCPEREGESILKRATIGLANGNFELTAIIKIELNENCGGSDKHRLDWLADEIRKHCSLDDIHCKDEIKITFSIDAQGQIKKP